MAVIDAQIRQRLQQHPAGLQAEWFLAHGMPGAEVPTDDDIAEHFARVAPGGAQGPIERFRWWTSSESAVAEVIDVSIADPLSVIVTYRGRDEHLYDFTCRVDASSLRITEVSFARHADIDIDVRALPTTDLSAHERAGLHGVFDAAYEHADHDYLEDSLTRFDYVAMAWSGDNPVGFALADYRIMDLPGLPGQLVTRGGLGCVDPGLRRRGTVAALVAAAAHAAWRPEYAQPRQLSAARFAHPATFRFAREWQNGVVPCPGAVPTPWHQQIGTIVAASLGAADFLSDTFVCVGPGRPVGQPLVHIDVHEHEWSLFEAVDRDRGDTLLGIGWVPNPPPGW